MLNLKSERIVLTGGAGFLGRHLHAELLTHHHVPPQNLFLPRHADYDLTREPDVIRMYDDFAPTVVIHLAAEVGGIGANRAAPGRFFYANLAMGLHLIEHARLRRLKKFVQVGTICAYPKFTPVPFREDDLWSGYPEETNAPYGLAKKALLVMLQAYRAQYQLNGIYLLPVNLYGPHDNFDPQSSHVIPALIRKFCHARDTHAPTVTVWGTGRASREFLYVTDAARGIALATIHYDQPDPVNLGAGFEITIKDLAHQIQSLTGYPGQITFDPSKPDGQPRRCLDTSRAQSLFHFSASTPFPQGLQATIHWYQSHHPSS